MLRWRLPLTMPLSRNDGSTHTRISCCEPLRYEAISMHQITHQSSCYTPHFPNYTRIQLHAIPQQFTAR
ncbi:hypothetical protein E2C01_070896 [Portunus trituberculatus]|uniref:Uncharacterized protein n=1 Tax=Portunus trituberculatus TaxID=210409 RepID=A0A5B7HYK2_PORTR|nr:hypothetical protein [Portunus trituberculatus]